MTLVRETVRDAAIGVGVTDTPCGLSAIRRPGCAAVVWRRQLSPGLQGWIDQVAPDRLPRARAIVEADKVRDVVSAICARSGTPDCREREYLIDDVAAMADMVAQLMQVTHLSVRFDVVTDNACERFHIDALTARLICTYRGTGTQYGIITDGEEPRCVFTVPTGAPIFLRGTLWPEQPRSGLLHRSPPIEGTGETRLVLVLDPTTG